MLKHDVLPKAYMETLDSLQIAFAQDPRIDTSALIDIREALMKLIARMDGLEESFERTVERSSKLMIDLSWTKLISICSIVWIEAFFITTTT